MARWNVTINNRLLIHKHRLASLLKNLKNTKNAGYMVVFNGFDHLVPPKEDFKYILSYFWHVLWESLGCLVYPYSTTAQHNCPPGDMLTAMGHPNPHMGFNSCEEFHEFFQDLTNRHSFRISRSMIMKGIFTYHRWGMLQRFVGKLVEFE